MQRRCAAREVTEKRKHLERANLLDSKAKMSVKRRTQDHQPEQNFKKLKASKAEDDPKDDGRNSEKKFHGNGKKLQKDTAVSRRERKLSRKMQKPNFELSKETLKIWEKLRIHKTKLSQEEKSKLVEQLLSIIKKQDKKLTALAYAHDTSRVLQCCLKQGTTKQRETIFEQIKNDIAELSKNQYSKNLVLKIMKYGSPSQRDHIIRQFAGLVPKLIRKKSASSVIEYAYNMYANKDQRTFLVQQLYGNSFNIAKLCENSTLEEVLKEQPEKREIILKNFKQGLIPLIDKEVISHTLVHRVFNEFLSSCEKEDEIRAEMIELLRESVIHMIHTRDGSHVGMQCLWHGTAKDRKIIIKTMKEFAIKLCQEEYGHLLLLAAFDCIDDTVLVSKALVGPIMKSLSDIITNKYARKVLLYLLTPRNKSHFLPETIAFLQKGDGNKHSKKPMDTRHKELTDSASAGLISYAKENLDTLVRDRSMFTLVETLIQYSKAGVSQLMESLCKFLVMPFEAGKVLSSGKLSIIEDPAGHLLIKHIVFLPVKDGEPHFSSMVLEAVDPEILCSWSSCNRGSQVLLSLLKTPDARASAAVRKMLKRNIKLLKCNDKIKSTQHLLENLET